MPIHELPNNPTFANQVQLLENVTYAAADGEPLGMDLLVPWTTTLKADHAEKRPLIVFVQGSSWTTPNLGRQIPQLVPFVQDGYIVATVRHRSAAEGHPFPAYLEDVKTAIRYLRVNASQYDIDPQRVAIWGTSSGANAALLVGLTPDDPRCRSDVFLNESDRVNAVVSCFAPTDVKDTFEYTAKVPGSDLLQYSLFGTDKDEWDAKKKAMSPLYQVKKDKDYPPFILLHGDADKKVPYDEMESMYKALQDQGVDVEAYRVKNADHERDFWSPRVYSTIHRFLDQVEKPSR